ncbi:S-layer homology domain-containing protein [Cohnella sp. LGH]|uniref:S-layer homology domain-containing protein n=1 Tax=Cohnella sp. LGH TaxID=1619153 RepID=UPI001ADBFECE|nr:S-layer homology domain-containing protein [Cohnella sp. LGH]QTH46269.1 S-layer homology domain-containing protein [Cohnella sp. LGH]
MFKLLRKSLSIIMALSVFLSLCSVAAAASDRIKFKLKERAEGRPGYTISVPVEVEVPIDGLIYDYEVFLSSDVPVTDAYWGQWNNEGTRIELSVRIADEAPSGDYQVDFDRSKMWVKKGTTSENTALTTEYDTVSGVISVTKQISVGQASGSAGGYVELPISTNSTTPISAYGATLPYNRDVFEVVDVTAAGRGTLSYEEVEDEGLVVSWNNDGDSSVLMTNGPLFKVKFKIKGDASVGFEMLSMHSINVLDASGEGMYVDSRMGHIEVTENEAPTAGNVNVSGTPHIGATLQGDYTFDDAESDAEGVSTFKWYRANDAAGAAEAIIAGADTKEYVLQQEDKDKYIRFEVTPIAVSGTLAGTSKTSVWTGPIGVPTYQVLYEANGATQGDVPADSSAYVTGQEATVLGNTGHLAKAGHTFGGWTTDEANLEAVYAAGDLLPIESTNRTLYAKWDLNRYQVNFNTNGGSAVPSVEADYDTLIAEPQRPSRSGYSFSGWYKEATLTDKWTFASDKVVADTTLYAGWSQNSQGGGGGAPAPAGPAASEQGLDVLVNGKGESAAKADTKTENGLKKTVVTVDGAKLESKLNEEKAGGTLTVPVAVQSDSVEVEFEAGTMKALQQKQMVIVLQTPGGTYSLPASQIDLQAVSGLFGSNVSPEGIKVRLKIAKPSESQGKTVQGAIAQKGLTLVGEALEFTVEAAYGERSIEIASFSSYVERSIVLPSGTGPNRITTGVTIDPDGTVRHVPTKVVQENGRYQATFNSLTNSTYAVVWNPVSFADVARHWAKDAVNEMGARLIIDGIGDNQFKPDLAVSRAEFTAIVVRALGLKQAKGAASSYSDVSATAWFSGAIESAKAFKLVGGFEDGTFRPEEKLTREQAVVILANAMELTGLNDKLSVPTDPMKRLGSFTDAGQVSEWARKAMAAAVEAGLVNGQKNNLIAAQSQITRAEVALIIQRLLEKSNLI